MKPIKPLCPIHWGVMTYGKDSQVFACQEMACDIKFTREEGYSPTEPHLGIPCQSDRTHKMFIERVFQGTMAWQWHCSAEDCGYSSEGLLIPQDFRPGQTNTQ
jgi:hypothetical protein